MARSDSKFGITLPDTRLLSARHARSISDVIREFRDSGWDWQRSLLNCYAPQHIRTVEDSATRFEPIFAAN